MRVSYDRCRLYSFMLNGTESQLSPVIARIMELEIPEDVMIHAAVLPYDEAESLAGPPCGDVNVAGVVSIVDVVPNLDFPAGSDQQSVARMTKSVNTLVDVLTMATIANRRFAKSDTWPTGAVSEFLQKCGVAQPVKPEPVKTSKASGKPVGQPVGQNAGSDNKDSK